MNDTEVRKNNILLVLYFILVAACSKRHEPLRNKEYVKWIENSDNGACVVKQISDFEFAVLYKPIDYIIAMESGGMSISKDSILKRKKELRGFQYYNFRIRSFKDNEFFRTGILSENEYYSRLEYFVSNAQEDIKLVEGKDTIQCGMYHFERTYGISPYNNIVVSFVENDTANTSDKTFIYDDKVLGVGKIAIKIKGNELRELPTLNYE